MEVKLVHKDKQDKLTFVIEDTIPSFANAIRRTIIEEVPIMAIEDIEFKKNTSFLYDELIAHRLGLVPLTTDIKSYNIPTECKCEGKGCARCRLEFSLSVKGPCTVYASDIKTKDPKVKPVHPKMIITKLQKGQTLELEGTAQLGKGKEHTKWNPGHVFYRKRPVVEITKDSQFKDAIVEACPQIFEIKNNKLQVIKDNMVRYDVIEAGVDACKDDAIKLSYANDFIFTVESWGQLDCKKMVLEAAKILTAHMQEFADKMKELK